MYIFSFRTTYTVIQKYRNKCGIVEYIAAGMTSGFLYKFNMGPRGWLVGAGLGKLQIKMFNIILALFLCFRWGFGIIWRWFN